MAFSYVKIIFPEVNFCRSRLLWGMVFAVLSAQMGGKLAQAAPSDVYVAVASNFANVTADIAAAFTAETGQRVMISSGSTGKLYAQIIHGAPYDVFLAADQARVANIISEGYGVDGSQFSYAEGRIILYSPDPDLVDKQGRVLQSDRWSHLAIANPKFAPYGQAAHAVLALMGALSPKIVLGENISQTFQFVATGNAELGFVSASQLVDIEGGSRWEVPTALYPPILQDAVMLTHGESKQAAGAFLEFLKTEKARAIMAEYGYGHPESTTQ